MKIKSKRIVSTFLIMSTLFGNISSLSAVALTRTTDPYSVIDNNSPINNGYDFLMQSDEPLKIRKKLLGDNISMSSMVGTYGTLHDNGDYFIYNLNDFLNGIEEFDININGEDEVLRIVPAPEMVYDDDFIGINYIDFGTNPSIDIGHYGNSAAIKDDLSVMGYLDFMFTGSGVELYSFSTKETGTIKARVYKEDVLDSGNYNTLEKYVTVYTQSSMDGYSYSEPIFVFQSTDVLPRKIDMRVGISSLGNLDKVKVYSPIDESLIDSSIQVLYDRYSSAKVDYIDFYISNENVNNYMLFEKVILRRYGHETPTSENISGRIVIDNTSGKYGNLVYNPVSDTVQNSFYRYELNGWLTGVEEFNIVMDGQQKILRIVPVGYLDWDKKVSSANLDIYIKSENMLSLSLDTNSVTFENYSGTEQIEKLGAINLTINSSLPYNLNAYMPSGITNSDRSQTIPIDVLNIKESSEGNYQTFISTSNKVVLKENCIKGNGINHSVDLKLDGSDAHKSDIYKTVIKFEAEQK